MALLTSASMFVNQGALQMTDLGLIDFLYVRSKRFRMLLPTWCKSEEFATSKILNTTLNTLW